MTDNLSTHSPGALYQAFPAEEARRVLRRLKFHYVPKHASWLNMVEIEIGVLAAQCLDRQRELPAGWLLDAAREIETFLPAEMRSPSDVARYKRLERSKAKG
jgi:DDE superfamily endonuclease